MIYIKSDEEIAGIRKSCHLLYDLFCELDGFIKPGQSTADIDKFSYNFIVAHKGKPAFLNYDGFPASACISVNDEVIHGIPSKKRIITEGDLVKVDLGINLDGYISDSTHAYEIGKVNSNVHKLNVVTREALYRGIDAAGKPGMRVSDISKAVFNHVTKFGYGVVREYNGHGVGLDVHEDPSVPNYVTGEVTSRLRKGMVIAIEPMITLGKSAVRLLQNNWTVVTLDGSCACHWEHTVAITDNGAEILTEY